MPDASPSPQLEECCQNLENRTEIKVEGRDDLVISLCKCGRRHFELTVDPVKLGLKFE